MKSFSVARLAGACFLSACFYPTPSVVIVVPPAASPAASAAARPGVPKPLPGVDASSEPGVTRKGNCRQETGSSFGVPYAFCYYTFDNPICTTNFDNCRRVTGPCVVGSTNDPPSTCG